jgi:hypothetical protein
MLVMIARLAIVLMLAVAAFAQESAEFARATGREVVLTPKGAAPLSGTLNLSLGNGQRYGVTTGGTLMQDHLWFFATASRQQGSHFAQINLPENAVAARVNAQVGASQDFSAFFANTRATASPFASVTPSSLFTMRYTGVISSNMFFTARFMRSEQQ